MHQLVKSVGLIGVLILLLVACTSKKRGTPEAGSSNSRKDELKAAPDFQVTTIEGDTVSLHKTLEEGRPMIVYFTASWCPICAKNWPIFSKVYPKYQEDLNFIAISIDPTDTREVMASLAKEKGFTFPTTWGHPQIMVDFGVENQATTVGIDRDGNIVFQKDKTALSEKEYRQLFDQLVRR